MELFHKILKAAADGHASDIHMKEGHPTIFRINRQLIAIEAPIPATEWFEKVIEHIVPKHLKPGLDKDRETDFSYFEPGSGGADFPPSFRQAGSLPAPCTSLLL